MQTDKLLAAESDDALLLAIAERGSAAVLGESKALQTVADFHNGGKVNAINALRRLPYIANKSRDFYRALHAFEKLIPLLQTPMAPLIDALSDVISEGDCQYSAGGLATGWIEFLGVDDERPKQALALVKEEPGRHGALLSPVLIALSKVDIAAAVDEAASFAAGSNAGLASKALFAISRMNFSEAGDIAQAAIAVLETIDLTAQDADGVSNFVRAVISLELQPNRLGARTFALLQTALPLDGALESAIERLWLDKDALRPEILDLVLAQCETLPQTQTRLIDLLDLATARLLGGPHQAKAISFFERYAEKSGYNFDPAVFDNFLRDILAGDPSLKSRLVTKWLAGGVPGLCAAVEFMMMKIAGDDAPLAVSPDHVDILSAEDRQFAARKSIGFLFHRPLAAASILCALLDGLNKIEGKPIIDILVSVFLLNYADGLIPYLETQAKAARGAKRSMILQGLKEWAQQQESIENVGRIKELAPGERERTITHHKRASEYSDAMRAAEENSILSKIVTKSVILNGRSTIHYVRGANGEKVRNVSPMVSHKFSQPLPSQLRLDPIGLHHLIFSSRSERRVS